MSRSYVLPIEQPDDYTCGPAAMKVALQIFGRRRSVESLRQLCKTTTNGTSTKNLVAAFQKLGYHVLAVEKANLRHLQSALKHKPNQVRAALVTYLYDDDAVKEDVVDPNSGHWAVVSSYSARNGRVILLDSCSAQKKSYSWPQFRKRWKDFDWIRKITEDGSVQRKKKWQRQLLLVVAKEPTHLPKFTIHTQKRFYPN